MNDSKDYFRLILCWNQLPAHSRASGSFHIGEDCYWLWDPADDTIVETFTIPRAVAVVAGGTLAAPASLDQELVFAVAATAGSAEFGIVQAPFMYNKARTTAFTHTVTVKGDDMRYSETTVLDIYGKSSYDHKDVNTLHRVA